MSANDAPNLILGTAGHIDHGKSSLILALTGVDPDRLAEEKKRGITIELGFAQLTLPDGRTMGVIDVPGHEKFVRQMIAGATGVDVALLVIAADDGIMPQTTEHIAVLQTLGVRSCVVALTKIDMVDEEWLELMAEDVRAFLAATPYADAPIVPVSSRTKEGLEDVRAAIAAACTGTQALHAGESMRQPVDRVFTIKGSGTVITGTLWSGTVRPDDVVEILPSGKRCRIKSVQMHGTDASCAQAGNRVALNLNDVKTTEIRPGDFLATPGLIEPTTRFDAHLTYLDTAKTGRPLESGTRMHIAHGTKEVIGRVLLADGLKQLSPGMASYAQIRLEEPLPVSMGDRFIVRTYSPVHVAGGGQVLLAHPRHRTNLHGEQLVLDALIEGNVQVAVENALSLQPQPVTAHDLARFFGMDDARMTAHLRAAVGSKRAVALGDANEYFASPATKQRAMGQIERTLIEFHNANPAEPGMTKEALRKQCFPRMDAACFGFLLDEAITANIAVANGGLIGHPSAQGAQQQIEKQAAEKLLSALRAHAATPPTLDELASEAGVKMPLARRALARLQQEGAVYRVSSELFYDGAFVDACKQRIVAHFQNGGDGSVGSLKDVIGSSRKFAVPLLEAFDAEGFTVRDGDARRLK